MILKDRGMGPWSSAEGLFYFFILFLEVLSFQRVKLLLMHLAKV